MSDTLVLATIMSSVSFTMMTVATKSGEQNLFGKRLLNFFFWQVAKKSTLAPTGVCVVPAPASVPECQTKKKKRIYSGVETFLQDLH